MADERNVVDAEWLARRLGDPTVVIADCRFDLAKPQAGLAEYRRAHVPGAVYLDLEADLSGPKAAHGGRHPLPDPAVFGRALGSAGIDQHVTVVAYDDQHGSMAARLWWMLRYLGHDRVKVLNGGWSAWRRGGYPTTAEVSPRAPRTFVARIRPELLVDLDELRRRLTRGGVCLVDSRAPERYRGEIEPLDPVAGHIPGAANVPWTDNQDQQGALKPVAVLRQQFDRLNAGTEPPIVYCGSGVTACANLLAMEEAGIRGAVLYLGGWSDWCSYPDNPVARES